MGTFIRMTATALTVASCIAGCESTPTRSQGHWVPDRADRFDACLERAAQSSNPAMERNECIWEYNRAQFM